MDQKCWSFMRIEGHTTDLEREIRELAMQYGLLSEYTSYLVQEPQVVAVRDGIVNTRTARLRQAGSGGAIPSLASAPPAADRAPILGDSWIQSREVAD